MYQMYAYGKEYNSPRVILLYPQYNGMPEFVADYEHFEATPGKHIQVRTIDISEPLSMKNIQNRIRKKLRQMVVEGESYERLSL